MRTFLRGKITLLFMMLGMLIAVPAVALADTLIITNDVTLATSNTNAIKNPGDTGTANVRLDVTNGTPTTDTSGCNANGSNPLTVDLKSNNPDVTFPSGDTAQITGCGVPVGVSYAVASGSQGGTAVISVDTYSGGRTDGTRLYQTTDTMTVTIRKPTSITAVSGTGTSGSPGSATLTAKLSSGTDDMSGKTVSFKVTQTGVCDDNTADLTLPDCPTATATTQTAGGDYVATANNVSLPSTFTAANSPYTITASFAGSDAPYYAPSSGTGNLVVTPPCTAPSVTSSPANQTVTYGDNASFTAAASGNPTPSVQWQKSTDNGTTWNNVSGATSSTLTVTNPDVSDSNSKYRAVFTNTCNGTKTATSNAATLTVDAKPITGSFTADNKVYDGTTAATVLSRSVDQAEVVGSDVVTLTGGTATFADKNVADDKTVTLDGATLGGADAGNYSLTSVSTTTANITAKALTITGLSAQDKVFDGNDSATITGTPGLDGVVTINNVADDVSLIGTATGTFIDALVGNDKDVTVSGLTLSGAGASNYSLTELVLSADILAWTTKGFFAPVDMGGVYNTVKGGSTVPLKFELFAGATELTATTSVKSLTSQKVSCTPGTEDAIEELAATGGTTLRYDTTGGQYIYNWQTPKQAGACYKVTVTAQDNTPIIAYFKTK